MNLLDVYFSDLHIFGFYDTVITVFTFNFLILIKGHMSQKLQISEISNSDLYFIPLNLLLKFYICIIY
jgi:hypothetical protein